jgi:hypothetical protein
MQASQHSTLDRQDLVTKFNQLQTQLCDRWFAVDAWDTEEHDILVIPSLSLDQRELQKINGIHFYEERLLFAVMRLRNPRTRVIYVTSQPIHPSVVESYLNLLPGIPQSHARDRLLLFCTYDSSLNPLTQKILDRPHLIARLRKVLRPNRTYMTCFNSTPLERELALQLNIPMLALDPELLYWGTKSGSRQIFGEAAIPYPDGSESIWTVDELVLATNDLWERHPELKRIVIKLNEGFSGEGNAILDLRPMQAIAPPQASASERIAVIRDRFTQLNFQCPTETWDSFSSRIPELGAIVEAFIEGEEKRSPSVQGCINPDGSVEILSTHDQILGGPDGQIFLGCTFPADAGYRLQLQDYGMQVGKILAAKGALERYSVDFIAVHHPEAESWEIQAIEINLRKGGTTHPFMTLKLVTEGKFDYETGLFYNRLGHPKYYLATDNLQSDAYRGLQPHDLIDIVALHHLQFNSTTQTGSIFHLVGCLSEFGKVGVTSIGNSPEEATAIYQQVVTALDQAVQEQ